MSRVLQPINHEIRHQIMLYKKNKKDISGLINNRDISNEDLSYCYISDLNLTECSISNVNFNGAKMKFQLQRGQARNCSFICANLTDGSSIRGADMRTCNLNGVYAPNLDFAYADLRECDVCDVTFTMFSKKGYKVKLDKNFLKMFFRFVDVEGYEFNDKS